MEMVLANFRFAGNKIRESQGNGPIFGFYLLCKVESNAICLTYEIQTFQESWRVKKM